MTNPADQLNASLAGRYAIERELGQGGMATVYLAQDVKHKRKVALKVLKPELGAVLGVACPCCSATWRTSRFCAFNHRPVCRRPSTVFIARTSRSGRCRSIRNRQHEAVMSRTSCTTFSMLVPALTGNDGK